MQANSTAHFQRWNHSITDSMQELRDKIAKARHAAEAIRISVQTTAPATAQALANTAADLTPTKQCIRSYVPRTVGLTTANSIRMSIAISPPATDSADQTTIGVSTPRSNANGNSALLFIQGADDGTFIALEMRRHRVRLVWNLGGNTGQLTHPVELKARDLKYNMAWYQIEVNRTMNLLTLAVAQMDNHGALRATPAVSGSTQAEHTRLRLSAVESRLWLGGVPANIRPTELLRTSEAQDADGANVAVHKLHIDGEPVGLWNFANSQGDCAGAMTGAHETTRADSGGSAAWHFSGFGYATVQKKSRLMVSRTRFSMQMIFKTFDENALLFLAVDESTNRSVSLTLQRGRLMFRVDYGNATKLEIGTQQRYNDGNWTKCEVARYFAGGIESGLLTIPQREEQSGTPTQPIVLRMLPNLSRAVYYLGGVPPGYRSATSTNVSAGTADAFLGCMRDIQVNGETYDPMESSAYFGVEPNCRDTIRMAGFTGNGWVALPAHSLRKRANFAAVVRTVQSDALVLLALGARDEVAPSGNYSVSLVAGRPHVWLQSAAGSGQMVRLAANATINDGDWHVLAVQKNGCRVELRVDDVLQDAGRFEAHACAVTLDAGARLFVGGAPDDFEKYAAELAPTFDRLAGAVKDVVFNNATLAFNEQLGFAQVQLGRAGPTMGGFGTGGRMGALLRTVAHSSQAMAARGEGGNGALSDADGSTDGRSFVTMPEECHRVSC